MVIRAPSVGVGVVGESIVGGGGGGGGASAIDASSTDGDGVTVARGAAAIAGDGD